jgi:hypothetical protein
MAAVNTRENPNPKASHSKDVMQSYAKHVSMME